MTISLLRFNTLTKAFDPTAAHECRGIGRSGGQGGAPGGAAPYVTGRARCLAARGGYVNPASEGATSLHPGASRRSIPPARFAGEGVTGKPRTHCAARMWKLGYLKFESAITCPGRDAARSSCEALLRRTGTPVTSFATGAPALQRTASQGLRAALRPGARRYPVPPETGWKARISKPMFHSTSYIELKTWSRP